MRRIATFAIDKRGARYTALPLVLPSGLLYVQGDTPAKRLVVV